MSGNVPNISQDTFDSTKFFRQLVKIQQGVPVTDSDWNEQAQLLLREIYKVWGTTLGQFVIPYQHSLPSGKGFYCTEGPYDNDFNIEAGWACLDGAMVSNNPDGPTQFQYSDEDENYMLRGILSSVNPTAILDVDKNFQDFHLLVGCRVKFTSGAAVGNEVTVTARTSQTELAISGSMTGVLVGDTYVIAPPVLSTPGAPPRGDMAYLMAWWDDLNTNEDPVCTHPGLGIETSHRSQLRWCVRVTENGSMPSNPFNGRYYRNFDPRYMAMATMTRDAASITAGNFTDLTKSFTDYMGVSAQVNSLSKTYYDEVDLTGPSGTIFSSFVYNLVAALQNKQPIDRVMPLPVNTMQTVASFTAVATSATVEHFTYAYGWGIVSGARQKDDNQTIPVVNRLDTDNYVYMLLVGFNGIYFCGTQQAGVTSEDLDGHTPADWDFHWRLGQNGSLCSIQAILGLHSGSKIERQDYATGTSSPIPLLQDIGPSADPGYLPIYDSGETSGGIHHRLYAADSGIVYTRNAYRNESANDWRCDDVGSAAMMIELGSTVAPIRIFRVNSATASWVHGAWDDEAEAQVLTENFEHSGYRNAFLTYNGDNVVDYVRYALSTRNMHSSTQSCSTRAAANWHGKINAVDGASDLTISPLTSGNVGTVTALEVDEFGATIYANSTSLATNDYMVATGTVKVRPV